MLRTIPTTARLMTAVLLLTPTAIGSAAEDAAGKKPAAKQPETPSAERQKLYKNFEQTMSGSVLVGYFTVLGKEDKPPKQERYEIKSVTKLDKGELWKFVARVKYGKIDLEVPMALQVAWAGDTPVITLTDTKIPLLGTFSCRVVIYNGKYAGTWTHGKVGGHMFGRVEKVKEKPAEEKGKGESDRE